MQLLKNHVISNEAEKILKGSLKTFSPSSPSLKIQIMDGNVCLRCEGKTLLGDVNKLFSKNTSISGQTLGHFDHCIMCRGKEGKLLLTLFMVTSCLYASNNLLGLYFKFSLTVKVVGSNADYFLKSFFL